jgi:hypothetical protein
MLGGTFKETKEETISCPNSGETVVGGGVSITPGEGMIINEDAPTPAPPGTPTGWKGEVIQIYTGGNQSAGKFKVWVVCDP